jgi:hypothetical protein
MRRLPVLCLLSLALPLLAACTPPGQARQAYLSQFVGQPELSLINALGVPDRSYETDGLKFLAFVENRVDMVPPMSFYSPPYWGISSGFPVQVVQWQCETTVVIRNGVVLNFTLRGNGC